MPSGVNDLAKLSASVGSGRRFAGVPGRIHRLESEW